MPSSTDVAERASAADDGVRGRIKEKGLSQTMDENIFEKEEIQLRNIGEIIHEAGKIENLLDDIIAEYFISDMNLESFFRKTILNTCLEFGKKVRIVSQIAKKESLRFDSEPFHRIMSIRNAFAHNDLSSTLRMNIDTYEYSWILKSSKSDGTYTEIDRSEAKKIFFENIDKAEEVLVFIFRKINPEFDNE